MCITEIERDLGGTLFQETDNLKTATCGLWLGLYIHVVCEIESALFTVKSALASRYKFPYLILHWVISATLVPLVLIMSIIGILAESL